ncbi:DUF308 domain-containing protein [Candidatus Pacearchaeota archaeon]|nr:DUF308 domain-containing protein [Candidatus Pacearchaeota archaeon]
MSKKESRLSPKVRELLKEARIHPERALRTLESINLENLNMYEKQKIGREVIRLFRSYNKEPTDVYAGMQREEYRQDIIKLQEKYDLPHEEMFKSTNARDRLELKKMGDKFLELNPDPSTYAVVGGFYAMAGVLDKAEVAYKKGIELADSKGPNRDYSNSMIYHSLVDGLEKVRQMKTERKKKHASILEGKLSGAIAIIGLIGGLFFMSPKITGNVIGLSKTSSNLTGILLFILGLAGLFIYIKRRN